MTRQTRFTLSLIGGLIAALSLALLASALLSAPGPRQKEQVRLEPTVFQQP
jgi:hypothetical protein